MKANPQTAIVFLFLSAGLVGCDDSLTPPTPWRPSPLDSYDGDRWDKLSTYRGHTGPEACIPPFDETKPRTPVSYLLMVRQFGTTIDLVSEHTHHVGTVTADQFVAREVEEIVSTWQCGGARLRYRAEGQLTGRFSADGRVMTGEEVAVFLLESGETIRRYWDWTATRQ